jgi:hypothetical protein
MTIKDRVALYKKLFKDCKALPLVQGFTHPTGRLEALEAIRTLNTALADAYMVSIPVITVWVRDNSYVPETGEIFLTEPDLEAFLHQFRHHLQNVERKYERRGLTTEGDPVLAKVPYEDGIYMLRGEDDAIAWSKFLVDSTTVNNKVK